MVVVPDLSARVAERVRLANATVPDEALEQLVSYLTLLGKWNHTINLTAFDLDAPSNEAIDRLIVEPIVAARHVAESDRFAIDLGSGGGSPALPLKIVAPWLHVVLVEVKTRKSAFLREAIRHLHLTAIDVETRRVEELTQRPDLHESSDLVTLRAVRVDDALWRTINALLRPGARVLWFGAPIDAAKGTFSSFTLSGCAPLISSDVDLTILQKSS